MNRIRLSRTVAVEVIEPSLPGDTPQTRELDPAGDPMVQLVVNRFKEATARDTRRQSTSYSSWTQTTSPFDRCGRIRGDLAPPFEGTHPTQPSSNEDWFRREGRDAGTQPSH
jgi:hypothetical protein